MNQSFIEDLSDYDDIIEEESDPDVAIIVEDDHEEESDPDVFIITEAHLTLDAIDDVVSSTSNMCRKEDISKGLGDTTSYYE
ncbi:hypothetical protein H5410_051116 [Solanum commersonii]|uniref:Uncharacterized protein n=1 Tax=Solanum commersonii TaxID=4109 RepID=A0A9J5WXB3_SOLCO|nr:hypothetical protein H5410_051116 [Solanum commersonii]